MKQILTLILIALSLPVIAKDDKPEFFIKPVTIGATATGDSINGTFLELKPFTVTHYSYDDSRKLLYLQMTVKKTYNEWHNKDYYVCFDMLEKKIVWESGFSDMVKEVFFIGNTVARNESRSAAVYHTDHIASIRRDSKDWVELADRNHNQYITMDGMAIDGETGKELWYADIKCKRGWNNIAYSGPDTLMVAAEGLQAIDLNTGNGWYHKFKTGTARYAQNSSMGNVIVSGIAAGIIGGVALASVVSVANYSAGRPGMAGMCSNILTTGDACYMAGAQEIVKVNKDGTLAWKKLLPGYKTGSSVIWLQHDSLMMLNMGYIEQENGKAKHGGTARPYFCAFNTTDGSELYLNEMQHQQMVSGYLLDGDTLFLRFQDEICIINTHTGQTTKYVKTERTESDFDGWLLADEISVKNKEGKIAAYNDGSRENLFLYNGRDGMINIYSKTLKMLGTLKAQDYYRTFTYPDYLLHTAPGAVMIQQGVNLTPVQVHTYFQPQFKCADEFVSVGDEGVCFYSLP